MIELTSHWAYLALGLASGILLGAAEIVAGGEARKGRPRDWRPTGVEAQAALEAERARIARDMHDELGTHVTRIKLLGELIERETACPAKAFGYARRISRIATELAQAMDEIVWAVSPEKDRLENFVHYLSAFTEELLSATHLTYRLDFPKEVPEFFLPADVRHNLFLAAKEALHNAVKHSRGTTVHVGLSLTGELLEVSVRDDGVGFAPAAASEEGDGLRNLCERLRAIGGTCAVQSQPGQGTSIHLLVPLPCGSPRDARAGEGDAPDESHLPELTIPIS